LNTLPRIRPPWHWTVAFFATGLAYALTGLGAVMLAIPPGYASPLYPSAGIALACVIVFGPRMLPAVALGAFAVNLWLGTGHELTWAALVLPAALALGATLQAGAGASLVRRFVRQPLTLSEPREIALFFATGAFAACVVSASIGTAALGWRGVVQPSNLAFTWLTWWMGDSLGVLIAAPIVLTLIGQPREDWVTRRLTVGLTLAVVTALLAASMLQVARWDKERIRATFEREATSALSTLSIKLQQPLYALEALRGVYAAQDDISRDELRRATQSWVDRPGVLLAMGFQERVLRADVAALEGRAQADGFADFRVVNRTAEGSVAPFIGDEAFAIRYIEPLPRNVGALGVNALSVPASRAAIESAVRTGLASATSGFRLSQDAAGTPETGIVIYQAIYKGEPRTAPERQAAARGVVFATVRLEDVLRSVVDQLPAHLTLCVVDVDTSSAQPRLAGPIGCDTRPGGMLHATTIAYAGRQWRLQMNTVGSELPVAQDSNAWLFSTIGLLSAAVLGAMLLAVTGRTQRIEAAVRERTFALQLEVRERQQAEIAMRDSEQRFRNIFNHVPIGVVYTDLRGHVLQTNPRFCELTGYDASELLGMPSLTFTHPDDVAQDADLARQLVSGEIPSYRRNKRYIARDGHTLWVQSTVSLLRDEQGHPRHIVGAVEDITEHLALAEAQQARAAAEASNHAKSEFLSRMSHELRTPLNAMLGFAQLLELDKRHPLTQQQIPWVGQIQHAGWHLLEMINDVLDLSRVESGNVRLQIAPVDLSKLLSLTLPLVEQQARKRGIVISQALAPDAVRVQGDATRVKQILTNLLTNAAKYNVDGGRIHVSTQSNGVEVEISVTDSGLGMTPAQMAELFQPFNRLGRERSTQEGTGIGLVISRRLAELMGGSLRARSRPDEGSVFILTLPAIDSPDTVRSDLDELAALPAAYHRRLVHYIEDNETNVEVMRGVLAQRPQVLLEVSITGLDGLAAIRIRRPDVILLDMHLPDISGLELLRHLKADPSTSGIPVVAVSADALASQIDVAMDSGALRYLTKPVNVAELLAVIDEVLDAADTRFG
jgi:PAS domain S-box-containing protein